MNGQGKTHLSCSFIAENIHCRSCCFGVSENRRFFADFSTKAVWRPGEDCTVEKWSPAGWQSDSSDDGALFRIRAELGMRRGPEHMASGASFQNKSTLHAPSHCVVPVLTNNARVYSEFSSFKLSKITLRDDNLPSYTMVLNYIPHFSCVMTISRQCDVLPGWRWQKYWLRRRHMFVERSGIIHQCTFIYTSDRFFWMLGFTHIYLC